MKVLVVLSTDVALGLLLGLALPLGVAAVLALVLALVVGGALERLCNDPPTGGGTPPCS